RSRTTGCSRATSSRPTSSRPGSTTSGRTRSIPSGCARIPTSSPCTSTFDSHRGERHPLPPMTPPTTTSELPPRRASSSDVDAAADGIGGGCPVVLFTSRTDTTFVERARTAGVMAYLLKPLRPAELAPALDLAVARFGEAQTLRLRLDERKVIERAKGALMRRYNLSEEAAFQRLRRAAMDSRRSMADISRALLVSESVAGDVPAE